MLKKFTTKRIVLVSLFTAASLIAFLIEQLFPPLFVPGAKLGLSNIFSLAALVILGPLDAIFVVTAKTVIGSLFGNVSTLIYSFSAGIISICVQCILFYFVFPRISLISISVVGAIAHNLTQNAIYALMIASPLALVYLPYLAVTGVIGGLLVGTAVHTAVKKIPSSQFQKLF